MSGGRAAPATATATEARVPGAHAAVRLTAVGLTIDGRRILDAVGFTVAVGQHWVILGPNGSGKTTILQIIAGYQWPTRGRVSVLGRELGAVDVRELRREIGIVSTAITRRVPEGDTCLQVVMSGRFASLGLFYQRPTEADVVRGRDLLAQVGCGELADRAFGVLSAGERQRVMLARALMPSPRLLLLDEPTARLDIGGRESFFQVLSDLVEPGGAWAGEEAPAGAEAVAGTRTGAGAPQSDQHAATPPTVLFVTHHVEEVVPIFTHALLLKRGRVVASGPVDEALTSERVSEAYGLEIHVVRRGGRLWALPVAGGDGRGGVTLAPQSGREPGRGEAS